MFVSPPAKAKKLDWSMGYFTIVSQTPTTKSKLSNLGAYQISHRFNLLDNVEFSYGYSLTFTKFLAGDYGYGPDMGLYYFPFGSAGMTRLLAPSLQMHRQEILRPFVVMQFHARQFQSIGASYAGFSFGGGVEYWKFHPLGIRFWAKNTLLKGPQKSTATEMSYYWGLSWEY
jgi:hypothetical protein